MQIVLQTFSTSSNSWVLREKSSPYGNIIGTFDRFARSNGSNPCRSVIQVKLGLNRLVSPQGCYETPVQAGLGWLK